MSLRDLTVCVCTYNSVRTLGPCLDAIIEGTNGSRLVVVDHFSVDGSANLARAKGFEVHTEDVGLGRARQLCLDMTSTVYLAFVDSDVRIIQPDFFASAIIRLQDPKVGAIVGLAKGHALAYGLPASLLVVRKADFPGRVIPDAIDARETYFIQLRLDRLDLRTAYFADSIIHTSGFRSRKPEWEGANTRVAAGVNAHELLFCLKVMLLMSINSRRVRNMLYVPISYLKFLRGFVEPEKWRRLERSGN